VDLTPIIGVRLTARQQIGEPTFLSIGGFVPAAGSPCECSVQLILSKELDQASRADTDKVAR
jgi:hypothetical protein